MRDKHIAIIGAGITGLAAALRLERLIADKTPAVTAPRITIYEASSRIGGKIVGDSRGPFRLDPGADVFMLNKEGAQLIIRDLELESKTVLTDPDRRRTFARDYGSTELTEITMYDNEPLASFKDGMAELVSSTAAALKHSRVRLSTPVSHVSQTDVGGSGRAVNAESKRPVTQTGLRVFTGDTAQEYEVVDGVILATSASQVSEILKNLMPHISRLMDGVRYTKTTTVSVGISGEHHNRLDGYGYIVRNAREGSITACTWCSSKIKGRAPEGSALLRFFIRGTDLEDTDYVRLVHEELTNVLGIHQQPLFTSIYRWPEAIPVYSESHPMLVNEFEEVLSSYDNLVVAGAAIEASGIPDSILSGYRAADIIWKSVVRGEKVERPYHFSKGAHSKFFSR